MERTFLGKSGIEHSSLILIAFIPNAYYMRCLRHKIDYAAGSNANWQVKLKISNPNLLSESVAEARFCR